MVLGPCDIYIFDPLGQDFDDWQVSLSRWIVDCDCRHMYAFGKSSESWDESVDMAYLEKFNYDSDKCNMLTSWDDSGCPIDGFLFFIGFNMADDEGNLKIVINLSDKDFDIEVANKSLQRSP
jgi:hypothetical protein